MRLPTPPLPAAGQAHKAEGDLFLCPTVRLLADTPVRASGSTDEGGAAGGTSGSGDGALVYEYDGGGHRLVLPDKGHLGELNSYLSVAFSVWGDAEWRGFE